MNNRPDFDIAYIALNKQKSTLLREGADKNLVYNYLAGILARRIMGRYNEDIHFIFDQRSTRVGSLHSLGDYIKIIALDLANYNHNVVVDQRDSRSNYLLQAADIVAGTVNGSYVKKNTHFINIIKNRIEIEEKFPRRYF